MKKIIIVLVCLIAVASFVYYNSTKSELEIYISAPEGGDDAA